MGFLWGKKDEFEKDNNTLRGAYKLNPSFGFIDKKKYFEVPVLIYTDVSKSDSYKLYGGMVYQNTNRTLSSFTKMWFGSESYNDSYAIKAGIVYNTDGVSQSSFIEYRFFSYPWVGYKQDPYVIKGDIVYTYEVV